MHGLVDLSLRMYRRHFSLEVPIVAIVSRVGPLCQRFTSPPVMHFAYISATFRS